MKPITQAEQFRRERFVIFDDLGVQDRQEIRRLIAGRCDFSDVADQFDTDVMTVWRVVFGASERKKKAGKKPTPTPTSTEARP